MANKTTTDEMTRELRPLLASDDTEFDFIMPSMLRDIPSYTSDQSGSGENKDGAKLHGHIERNFRRTE